MDSFNKDFTFIFETMTGNHRLTPGVPWVRNLFTAGTPYDQAYQTLWDSRVSIGNRFGIHWEEDPDLEQIMQAISDIEECVAMEMFLHGIEYAKRGFQL